MKRCQYVFKDLKIIDILNNILGSLFLTHKVWQVGVSTKEANLEQKSLLKDVARGFPPDFVDPHVLLLPGGEDDD